jgi:hypothetical protein
MSARARAFVESWVNEYVHPTTYESENRHPQSKANSAACYESALIEGIGKNEIDEEFGDLEAYMARAHEDIIDRKIDEILRKEK